MSLLLPSASLRPFATSGTAVTPPVPVLVAWPAPRCLNHASIVNVADPSAGAGPNVTYAPAPGNRSAVLLPAAAATVAVIVSDADSAPSLEVSLNTYVPGNEKVADVAADVELAKLTTPGPLVWLHENVSGPPGRLSSVADPFSVTEAGSVTDPSGPAFTTGGRLTGTAAFT